ncbi:calcium:proton antiporter [Kocuria marina]|uniref:Calcium:proton antiporter n=1 Tax=Kocuria marina TaxID=223184 RepID=A0A0B0DBS8_9MICC|nr:calcium:proton antiporter [Kocuria marina]KHE73597.1 calcium:proton antiporter [Kocuria marina]
MSPICRSILTPGALARVIAGWGFFVLLQLSGSLLAPPVSSPLLVGALVVIVGVILYAATGVVRQAEHLAHRLGDPYGSLVLTLSIVVIEVVLISAVMLGPGEHATIARDSVMAVAMIILNLVIGLCLLVGGLKHGDMAHNRTGTSNYLALLVVLSALTFVLPAALGTDGAYQPWQEISIIAVTVAIYAFFLYRQTGAQAVDFTEVDPRLRPGPETAARETTTHPSLRSVLAEHRTEILARLALLVITVVPIVVLSHDMASLLDDGLGRVGAPPALAGALIAAIVFLPESLTALRAALAGEIQRVSNLCHGALVSTVGLTIPAILVIGLLTDQTVVLAESPANLALLGITLGLSLTTFASSRVTSIHGAAHLVIFAAYGIAVFS